MCDERLAFLKRLKTWPVFGRGWARRVAEVRAAALAMAMSARQAGADRPLEPAQGKGAVPDSAKARRATAGGIAAGGAVVAGEAHAAGAPPGVVIAILAAVMIFAAASWLTFRWRRRRRQLAIALPSLRQRKPSEPYGDVQ